MNPLICFKRFLENGLDLAISNSKLVLTLFSLILIFLLSQFKPLDIHITIDQLINKEFQSSKDYFSLKKEFKLGKSATILFQTQNQFNSNQLCEIRKKSQELVFFDQSISNYFSPLYLRKTEVDTTHDPIQLTFPYFLKLDCSSPTTTNLDSINQTPWKNVLLSPSQHAFLHEVELEQSNEFNFDTEIVPQKFETVFKYFGKIANVKSYFFGDVTYQYYFKKGLDLNNALNILIIIIVGIFFKKFYGTFISTFLFIGTVIVSSIILFSLMSLFHVPIDILNNSLILLMTVSSLGDFVFLSSEEVKNNGHWMRSFKKIITPSFFTSFTTFIGFISLCSSDIEVIRRLGLWGGISGMIEWFVVMFFLPPFLKIVFKEKSWVKKSKNENKEHFIKLESFFNRFISKKLASGLLIFVLFIPLTIRNLNINDNPEELFTKSNPFRQSIETLKREFNFVGDVSLVFKDKSQRELNIGKLEKIKSFSSVSKVENPYDSFNFYTQAAPEKYHQLIKEKLEQTLQFQRFFSNEKMRSIIYLNNVDMKEIEKLRIKVRNEICQDNTCYLSGALIAYADFSQTVPKTLIESFLFSIILVVVIIAILSFYTNNTKNIFKLMLSSIWGVSILLFFIYLFQIQMNFVTCVVISILVGMTGDNTIQYLLASSEGNLDEGLKDRSNASIINSITMITCSLIFVLYAFEPPKTFGILLMFGLFLSLVGDYWILKGLIKKAS